jgi:hypothetical protein
MSDPIRQAIPTPEQLQAIAAGFGRVGIAAQLAVARMVEAFSAAAQPMPDPTFGRKRRARRARGRRIEARRARGPGLLTIAQWAAAHRTMQRQQLATFTSPSLGQPWEEQADG